MSSLQRGLALLELLLLSGHRDVERFERRIAHHVHWAWSVDSSLLVLCTIVIAAIANIGSVKGRGDVPEILAVAPAIPLHLGLVLLLHGLLGLVKVLLLLLVLSLDSTGLVMVLMMMLMVR